MYLALKSQIRKLSKQDYLIIKQMCRDSKDLYNKSLYEVRQHFFKTSGHLTYFSRYKQMKNLSSVKRMKSDFSMHVQQRVDFAFKSFLALDKMARNGEYDKEKVNIPHYLPKDGYYNLFMSPKSIGFDSEYFYFHPTSYICKDLLLSQKYKIKIPFTKKIEGIIKEVQIIPKNNARYFELLITYEYDESKTNLKLNKDNLLSIDLGLDNLATCLDLQSGRSFILDGRKLKSLNRWWNKEVARLRGIYEKQKNSQKKKGEKVQKSSKQLDRLSKWRKGQIGNALNQMVAHVIKYCASHNIGTIVIGDWKGIKDGIQMRHETKQNFVQLPYNLFKQKLYSKCQMFGLGCEFQEESYTSKCSFLEQEKICKHKKYMGKRIYRGLFRTSKGIHINSDVNGAGNIGVKFLLNQKQSQDLKQRMRGDRVIDPIELSSGLALSPKRIRLPDFEKSQVKMSELVALVANEQKQTSLEVT